MIEEEIKKKKKKKKKKASGDFTDDHIKKKKNKKKKTDEDLDTEVIKKRKKKKKTGLKDSENKFDKKKHFEKKKKKSNKEAIIGAVALVVVVIGYVALGGGSKPIPRAKKIAEQTYQNNIEMTDIKIKVENGKLIIPFNEIIKNKLITFKYEKNQVQTGNGIQGLPMLAYAAPSGNVVVAISMCEPCKSIRLHLEPDNTVTCNVCGTKFDAESLEGITGQCTKYNPDEVKYTFKDGNLLVEESEVATWKPRI